MFLFAIPHIPWGTSRNIQQTGIFHIAFNTIMRPGQRFFIIVRNVLVEFFVLFFFDLFGRTGPQRSSAVHLFPATFSGFVLAFSRFRRFPELNRDTDVIGILADHGTQTPVIQEFGFIFSQMQNNIGATTFFGDICHGEIAITGRLPAHSAIRTFACNTADYSHFVCDDKG